MNNLTNISIIKTFFQAFSCATSMERSLLTACPTPPSSFNRETATTRTASTPPPSVKSRLVISHLYLRLGLLKKNALKKILGNYKIGK
jgi:hypothetical protein